MTEKNLTNVASSALAREAARRNYQYLSPAVDIFETEEGLMLVADMPGVDDKSLEISIEQEVLTIRGEVPAGSGDFRHKEFALAGYWRQFVLSDIFDAEKTDGSIRNGVVTLKIPKAETSRPKRIEVSVH